MLCRLNVFQIHDCRWLSIVWVFGVQLFKAFLFHLKNFYNWAKQISDHNNWTIILTKLPFKRGFKYFWNKTGKLTDIWQWATWASPRMTSRNLIIFGLKTKQNFCLGLDKKTLKTRYSLKVQSNSMYNNTSRYNKIAVVVYGWSLFRVTLY